jgi:hypothetical protein
MATASTQKDNKFLYAEDFLKSGQWTSPTVTIKAVIPPGELKGADGQTVQNPSLQFDESPKLLVLNRTNLRLLRIQFGTEDWSKWAGEKVTLYATLIACFGEQNVPAIRVRMDDSRPVPFGVRKFLGRDLTGTKI